MELGDFSKWARGMGDRIEKNADHLVRTCALAIDGSVVLATPVDTGRARANWQVEVNGPATGTVEPTDKSGQAAINAAKAKVPSYKGGSPSAAIHITNNLAYIGALNGGHSKQAPAGFVEKAIMVGVEAVRSAGGIASRKPT